MVSYKDKIYIHKKFYNAQSSGRLTLEQCDAVEWLTSRLQDAKNKMARNYTTAGRGLIFINLKIES